MKLLKGNISIAFLILTLTGSRVFAQKGQNDSTQKQNLWIETMDQYLTLRLNLNTDLQSIGVKTNQTNIDLKPNAKTVSTIALSYKFLSISFSFIPKFLPGNDDDEIRGKSKGSGFGVGFNFRHWQQELSYSKTKGYYLTNTSDFVANWKDGDPYLQFPDLQLLNFQGITAYNFNPNFSVSAIATQSTRQLKSAGSFIPQLLYRYYIVDDRTPVPASQSQKSNNIEVVLGAGYYYTYVLKKKFYASFGLTPGGGYIFTKLTTRSVTDTFVNNSSAPIFRLEGRAGVGYNSDRFFAGIYARGSGATNKQGNTTAVNHDSRITAQIFFGYRLDAPKFLREGVDKVEKVISP